MQEKFTITNFQEIAIICCLVAIPAYFLLRRNPRLKYHLSKLGGPSSYPIVGSLIHVIGKQPNEYIPLFDTWDEKHGPVFAVWVGNFIPYVCVSDPDVIEKILSTTSHINKGKYDYSLLHDWLGLGLLTAPKEKWFSRRKLLTPSFHFKILEDFIPIFNEQASVFINCLSRANHDADNAKTFDMEPYIKNCTLDIICETAMGKRINAQTSKINKNYIDAVNGMTALLREKMSKPWYRVPIIYKCSPMSRKEAEYLLSLQSFTKKIIRSRKKERIIKKALTKDIHHNEEIIYGKERKAFLDLLLDSAEEAGQILSDNDIREEVDTFMFEGHDTISLSLVWTILLLASHPKCQKRVQEELDELFSNDPSRDVSSLDISKMKYLECCIKESLRLYPSVPFIMRQVDSDILLENGNIIPKGVTLGGGIYYVHRNPQHFPEPHVYNPDRFLQDSENYVKRHPYAYLPFSAGPRNCIGQKFALMEEKIILAKLFRSFEIETEETMESLLKIPDIVLRCENGAPVKLRKRNMINPYN